ncbi:SymE family type I addiction module toxin [Orbus wheelerorum]
MYPLWFTNPRPQLTINGRWLEQLGFYPGLPSSLKLNRTS